MNDETENNPGTSGEPAPQESQSETAPADDGAVTEGSNGFSETMDNLPSEEYVLEDGEDPFQETISITVQETILSVGSDIVHTNLFGSFLICGTLIGLVIWRKFNGA